MANSRGFHRLIPNTQGFADAGDIPGHHPPHKYGISPRMKYHTLSELEILSPREELLLGDYDVMLFARKCVGEPLGLA